MPDNFFIDPVFRKRTRSPLWCKRVLTLDTDATDNRRVPKPGRYVMALSSRIRIANAKRSVRKYAANRRVT